MSEHLNKQQQHWQNIFNENDNKFGTTASSAAINAASTFKKSNKKKILELGAGQGRDSMFFALEGFEIAALDYSKEGVKRINHKAKDQNLKLDALCHDIRNPLPYADSSFDGCFSHMLFCMALKKEQLEFLLSEVNRVLKKDALCIYTVRNEFDPEYKKGPHHGEDMYESHGFIVHYFTKEKVNSLTKEFELLECKSFEEGDMPKRLYYVVLKKQI